MHSGVRVTLQGQTEASPSRDSMQLTVVAKRDGQWRSEGLMNARRLTMERQLFLDNIDSLRVEAQRQVTDLVASPQAAPLLKGRIIPQVLRLSKNSRFILTHERIDDAECWKAAKVAIGTPQLANAMIVADRGDTSIMDLRTTDAALPKRGAKLRPIALGLRQENQTRRLKPG